MRSNDSSLEALGSVVSTLGEMSHTITCELSDQSLFTNEVCFLLSYSFIYLYLYLYQ